MDAIQIGRQKAVCNKYNAAFLECRDEQKLGVALAIRDSIYPINGLRLPPEGDASGWFIWAGSGELSKEADFFQPLHVVHLEEWCAMALPYIGLAPGWRFLIAPDYEDVWFDASLLQQI